MYIHSSGSTMRLSIALIVCGICCSQLAHGKFYDVGLYIFFFFSKSCVLLLCLYVFPAMHFRITPTMHITIGYI